MSSSCQATKERRLPRRRPSCCPCFLQWQWCNYVWGTQTFVRGRACRTIPGWCVMHSVSTTPGMRRLTVHKNTKQAIPLERGYHRSMGVNQRKVPQGVGVMVAVAVVIGSRSFVTHGYLSHLLWMLPRLATRLLQDWLLP